MQELASHSLISLDGFNYEKHHSLVIQSNPVLVTVSAGKINQDGLGEIITQYVTLLERLQKLARFGCERLNTFASPVSNEVHKIIEQEFLIPGNSFYNELRSALQNELSLSKPMALPSSNTLHFLGELREGLSENSLPFVIGILFGLACSGVLEIETVSVMVNEYARLTSSKATRGDLKVVSSDSHSVDWLKSVLLHNAKLNFQASFAKAIDQVCVPILGASGIKSGFHFMLGELDRWWRVCSLTYRSGISGAILRICFADQTSTGFYGVKRITVR